ncbi:carbohydrate kinase family protein [Wenjunlia tyrosinilytica]|uniref:Fructokinase n=1 Tax=Wenjunlia tyrosinilytica TaxID=1544741 RepID=A0A918DYJ3_9ACTN|nr:carbohydrate kinase [Wenjunlia tyrosinilytica]GGO92296.1 fructokinase [Wenjunlia tyrosinilytica]
MTLSRPIAVLGEAVADAFVEPGRSEAGELALRVLPGGGPANTAVALARLGTPTRFLGRLSNDVFGRLFRAHLTESGVDLTGCPEAAEPSTLAVADIDERGHARYSFHAEGTADWQWTRPELQQGMPQDAVCVHTGSLALVREPGGTRVEEMLAEVRTRATVSIDPNVRLHLVPPDVYRTALPRWCAVADILRLSDDDLAQIRPGMPVEEACDTWHAAGVGLVVITRGRHGAVASLAGERVRVPAPKVETVDSVGAGDAFTAGLLHWLHAHGRLGGRLDGLTIDEVREAATLAAKVAALTCSVSGANPPYAEQLDGMPVG